MAQDSIIVLSISNMSNERLKAMVEQAAGIVSLTNGKVKITEAMKLAGFTTPDRKNMTIY